jgi:hypothetical protein
MFEKWRIKEHMEVTDSAGLHIGTVDSVNGSVITLTRSDSADGVHHEIDVSSVERITDDRVELKDGIVLPAGLVATSERPAPAASFGAAPPASTNGYAGSTGGLRNEPPAEGSQLFGTSGLGTGMGGSGTS